jgi:hypothetical protein
VCENARFWSSGDFGAGSAASTDTGGGREVTSAVPAHNLEVPYLDSPSPSHRRRGQVWYQQLPISGTTPLSVSTNPTTALRVLVSRDTAPVPQRAKPISPSSSHHSDPTLRIRRGTFDHLNRSCAAASTHAATCLHTLATLPPCPLLKGEFESDTSCSRLFMCSAFYLPGSSPSVAELQVVLCLHLRLGSQERVCLGQTCEHSLIPPTTASSHRR